MLGLLCLAPLTFAANDSGKTFTIGIGITLDSLDPAQQTTTTVMNLLDYDIQTLVTFDEKGNLKPLLAKSWSWSDDGKTLTLKLRDDVKFHDGTPFNAKAVKFSLQRLIDGKVNVRIGAAYQVMKSIDAAKPDVVKIHLKHPDPNLLRNLGATMAAIVSPSSVKKGNSYNNTYKNILHPVGTGPYKLVHRTRGSELDFKRYADYWGKKPYYSKQVFKIIPESNELESGLRSGQLDFIMNPPVSDLKALASQPNIKVLKVPSDRSIYIAMQVNMKPLDNKKIRQALNYAVNKKAIIQHVLFGAVHRMQSPFAEPLPGYCKVGGYDYNPKKAKKLLSEAGASDLSLTLGTPRGRYTQDFQASQAVASYLRKLDIKVKVKTSDWASYVSLVNSTHDPYNMFLLGWAPMALDAPTQMQMFTKESQPPNGLNGSFYSNPKVEKLFKKAKQELDQDKRHKLYCKIQKQIWEDAPWIFLWSQNLILAYDKDIAGISYQPNEKFDTIYAHPK
jgi:peptide/nickel transport system substrate-binding protein